MVKDLIRKEAAKIRRNKLVVDESQCVICGFEYSAILNQHHKVPVFKDGDNKKENLIFVCPNCHSMIHQGINLMEKFKSQGYDHVPTHRKIKELKASVEKIHGVSKSIAFWKTLFSYIGGNENG